LRLALKTLFKVVTILTRIFANKDKSPGFERNKSVIGPVPARRREAWRGVLLSALLGALLAGSAVCAQTGVNTGEGAIPPAAPVRAQHALVVSIHHDASDAGLEVLRAGGNAVDAGVAVGFALAVVYPDAGNLGGGGFMLLRLANGTTHFMDFRETAPLAATENMYLDAQGNVVPGASTVGYAAIAVPGTVAGLVDAERRFGKLTLKQVMAPAIRLADQGYVLSAPEAAMLHSAKLSRFPESKRIFQRDGDYYKPGEVFKQPDLAKTLRRIADDPGDFYHGQIARTLVADMKEHGGLLTEKDLADYKAVDRRPLTGTYHQYQIFTAPPPSSGGIILLETLNILEAYNLSKMGDRRPQEMHLIIEAFRRAFMDRKDFLGDPDFVQIPVAALISKPYAAAWRRSIEPAQATPSASMVRPAGFLPAVPPYAPSPPESKQTTHYSVMDDAGNAVSVTYTLNASFGSGVTAEGLGFLLNDEMDDFSSKQGVPNLYGLIQGPGNSIAPRRRPVSSMTPTIVLENNKVRLVLGSPGGSTIPTTVTNILLSTLEGGVNIQDSVDAPRFHEQYLPDTVNLEPGFASTVLSSLEGMGYHIKGGQPGDPSWGNGECIALDPKTGWLEGGQDRRETFGKAAGY
jgi:gamma-glutamyltranspeptidase / glutathione hydrolase